MQLHQFLRLLTFNTPILIFDVAGMEICKVMSKDIIDVNLYEYPILEISTGLINFYVDRHIYGIFITIQK